MSDQDPRDVLAASARAIVSNPDLTDGLTDLVHAVRTALRADAVGILARGPSGDPELLCATSHRMGELEIYQVGHEEGPCVECVRTGVSLTETGGALSRRWPVVGPVIEAAGFHMVHAVPLLWRETPVGGINVFRQAPESLTPAEAALGRSFAAIATMALGPWSAKDRLAGSVISALNGWVVIEQAKGILFQRRGLDMPEAYAVLRAMAQESGQSVTATARDLLTDAQRRS